MSNNELEDIKIDSVRRETPRYRIKSYVVFLILIAIIFLVLLFLGSFGNDLFGLFVFIIIFSVPVILIFRNKLPSILPDFITDSLYEVDESIEDSQPVYSMSVRTKQLANLFGVVVLLIGAIVLIVKYRNQIADPMCFYKIMGSMLALSFAGIMLVNVTGEELSLTTGEEEEEET